MLENEYILILDDDTLTLSVTSKILEEEGFKYLTSTDPFRALELIDEHKVFLIISDYKMPSMNGDEFCKKVQEKHSDCYFAILTGFGEKKTVVNCLSSGVNDFIEKPIDDVQLLDLVGRFEERRRKEIEERKSLNAAKFDSFREEALQLLDGLDSFLITLNDGDNQEAHFSLFKSMHTIQNSAGGLGSEFEGIAKIAFAFEEYLESLRNSNKLVRDVELDHMLKSIDLLREMIENPDLGGENSAQVTEFVELFHSFVKESSQVEINSSSKPIISVNSQLEKGSIISNSDLDHLMDIAGNLVAFKNVFDQLNEKGSSIKSHKKAILGNLKDNLADLSEDLQKHLLKIRKVSLDQSFSHFPRIVRDMGRKLGKKIEIEMQGTDLYIDKSIAMVLSGALIHVIYNACDHGIEWAEERIAANKPIIGRLFLRIEQIKDEYKLTLRDDGRGLNKRKIIDKAVEKNLIRAEKCDDLSEVEVFNYIFKTGFSTADELGDFSGSGIGMDVVAASIASIGGLCLLDSQPGEFTCLSITIPVPKSVVIEPCILGQEDGMTIAVPLKDIVDIGILSKNKINFTQGRWSYQYKSHTLVLGSCKDLIAKGYDADRSKTIKFEEMVMVLSSQGKEFAVRVDRIAGQIDAVIKNFGNFIGKIKGFRGFSIYGEEQVSYVLSCEEIAELIEREPKQQEVA